MKRLLHLLLLLAVLVTPHFVSAQNMTREQRQAANMKLMPFLYKHMVEFYGNGMTLASGFMEYGDDPDFQKLAGTNDEQYYEFSDYMLQTREELRPLFHPILERAAAEKDPQELQKIADEMALALTTALGRGIAKLNETVTPEQLNRIRELEFQVFSPMAEMGFPYINYDAYHALDLNDRQKEELEKIRKEFAREQADFFIEMGKLFPSLDKQPSQKELIEFNKKLTEHGNQGKALVARIQARIVTILDKNQEKKLTDLQTNIPDFVKKKQNRKGKPAEQPIDEEAYKKWMESWKPGQPIPPEFRQREKARRRPFPM